MKKYHFAALFLLVSIPLVGQIGFIRNQEFGQLDTSPFSVLEHNGSYYTSGTVVTSYDPYEKDYHFAEHNYLGDSTDHHIIANEENWFESNLNQAMLVKDELIYDLTNNIFHSFIFRYDPSLNTLDTFQMISNPYGHFIQATDMIVFNDQIVSLHTLYDENNFSLDRILTGFFGTDSSSLKQVEMDKRGVGIKLINNLDTSILILGNHYLNNEVYYFQLEVSDDGTLLKEHYDNVSPETRFFVSDGVLDGDKIIVTGIEYANIPGMSPNWSRPVIQCRDLDGNEMWRKRVGGLDFFPYPSYHSRIVKSHEEDGYILAGHSWHYWPEEDSLINIANLTKISLDGDSIWQRNFSVVEDNLTKHYISDMEKTSDGGYIMAGELRCGYVDSLGNSTDPNAPPNFKCRQSLLIKVDAEGKINPNSLSDEQIEATDTDMMRIYPNPSSDLLFVEIESKDDYLIEIFNMTGQKIRQFDAPFQNHTYIVPLSDFVPGEYMVRILSKKGILQTQKFVKI